MLASRLTRRTLLSLFVIIVFTWYIFRSTVACFYDPADVKNKQDARLDGALQKFSFSQEYFRDFPLKNGDFLEMGRRVQVLTQHMLLAENLNGDMGKRLGDEVENLVWSMFPFLRQTGDGDKPHLRRNIQQGTRGIVIATSIANFRNTLYLITSLRHAIGTRLPIQVMYAGNEGLSNDYPKNYRDILLSSFNKIELVDVTEVLDIGYASLQDTQSLKSFALLASTFEQIVLLESDVIVLQEPSIFFEYFGYEETGTYMFQDRLHDDSASSKVQDLKPYNVSNQKPTLMWRGNENSTGPPADLQQDAGVIIFNKNRAEVTLALLYICWQNSVPRVQGERYSSHQTWWKGFDLTGTSYAFGSPHASIIGRTVEEGGSQKVCSSSHSTAHRDANSDSRILWFNRGLFGDLVSGAKEQEIPRHWMDDGTWVSDKGVGTCKEGGDVRVINSQDMIAIHSSIAEVKKMDNKFNYLYG